MRTGVVLTAVGVVALAASVVGYAVGYGGFGTAAGVVALASVGVGVGTLNDWSRHKSAVFNHRASRSAGKSLCTLIVRNCAMASTGKYRKTNAIRAKLGLGCPSALLKFYFFPCRAPGFICGRINRRSACRSQHR